MHYSNIESMYIYQIRFGAMITKKPTQNQTETTKNGKTCSRKL